MFGVNKDKIKDNASKFRASYLRYKLDVSTKYLKFLVFFIVILNLLLLAPDRIVMGSSQRFVGVVVARVVFSLSLLAFWFSVKKFKTFRSFSLIVSAYELFAVAVFLYVLLQYEDPHLLIQTMGIFIIILAIFLIPNKWTYMLAVSMVGGIGFLTCAYYYFEPLDMMEYWSAVIFIGIAISLCAQTAYMTETFQFREFFAKSELEHISSTDFLTNTANRYKMDEEANKWIDFCRGNGMPLALVFIDIDDFKTINDQYGHLIGDSVLTELTGMIRSQLRSTDIISRWGGDEFVVLFPNTMLADAVSITERIKAAISSRTFAQNIRITCCFGVAEMKEDSNFENMLKEADELMYLGKKSTKNDLQYAE